MSIVLHKQLAGKEDLLIGRGQVIQRRNGIDVPITMLDGDDLSVQTDLLSLPITLKERFKRYISVDEYGAIGDGTVDDVEAVQNAIKAAYDYGANFLTFTPGKTYNISKAIFFNGYPGSNGLETGLTIKAYGATLKLTAPTAGGGMVSIGRGGWIGAKEEIQRTGNLTWFGGTLDCNGISGENGLGMSRVHNVRIVGVKAMNGSFSDTREGGRGFTAHPASKNVVFENCYSYRMGDGYHFGSLPDSRELQDGVVHVFEVAGITKASQAVVTTKIPHSYVAGDYVYIGQVNGMNLINPSYEREPRYLVVGVTSKTLTIDVDTTSFPAYTGSGIVALSDELNYRNNGVMFINCIAEECNHSGLNGEATNQPRNTHIMNNNVLVENLTMINCGTASTDRGVINFNNVSGLRMKNSVVYNDSNFPVSDVIRGSFQTSRIELDVKVATARSIINYSPIIGFESSIQEFPFGAAFNNNLDIKIDARATLTNPYVMSIDRPGSGIDWNYRNNYNLVFYGIESDLPVPLFDEFTKQSQSWLDVRNLGVAKRISGLSDNLDLDNLFRYQNETVGPVNFTNLTITDPGTAAIDLDTSSTGSNRMAAKLNGATKAFFEFRQANSRWYLNTDGVNVFQFTPNNILPNSNEVTNLGSAGIRFNILYAVDGVINTSDEREKVLFDIDEAERNCALDVKKAIKKFKWLARLEDKKEDARIHFGVGAQTVGDIFITHGLDPANYGLFCYDEWEEERDDNGLITLPAGNRYGVRYSELAMFILAAL